MSDQPNNLRYLQVYVAIEQSFVLFFCNSILDASFKDHLSLSLGLALSLGVIGPMRKLCQSPEWYTQEELKVTKL